MSDTHQNLDILAREISQCRVCDEQRLTVEHCPPMQRGVGSDLVVIGIQPGSTEQTTGEAFSGPAGINLIKWLQAAELGSTREDILKRVHLTSLCKCRVVRQSHFSRAWRNCAHFLTAQLRLLQPRLCATVGLPPLQYLFNYSGSLEDIVGDAYPEHELNPSLFPMLPNGCSIVPLPHPSPVSRWLNSEAHCQLLDQALVTIKEKLR